jgi:hypothetical protein
MSGMSDCCCALLIHCIVEARRRGCCFCGFSSSGSDKQMMLAERKKLCTESDADTGHERLQVYCCVRQTRIKTVERSMGNGAVDRGVVPAAQLKPSKWPLRILSPMGDGALRGLPLSPLRVAERLGLVPRGETAGSLAPLPLGVTVVLGGVAGRGGDGTRPVRFGGFASALPRESLLRRPVPLVCWESAMGGIGCC